MTQFNPGLRLSRLVVLKSGQRAYDEEFHAGLNIIRGVPGMGNSVGKSTIADMIFYALGGDFTSWKPEAGSCDSTVAEVVIAGATVTMKRDISDSSQQPMSVFFGDFEMAMGSAVDGWQRFPYRRYSDKESFTQVLFRLLNMPEVPAEAESNITMHQLLRLMYVDQMTPVDRIFRLEARDSAMRRQAVGDLLCGVFDERLYPAQLELREREREYEGANAQYGALYRVLAAGGETINIDLVLARRHNTRVAIEAAQAEIESLKSHRFDDSKLPPDQEGVVEGLQREADAANAELTAARAAAGPLRYEIEDASYLIAETDRALLSLREGEITNEALGAVAFAFCPSCFSPLKPLTSDAICRLCHSPVDAEADRSRIARMRNELELQHKESLSLQKAREAELVRLIGDIDRLTSRRNQITAKLINISRNYLTESQARIDGLNVRLGTLESEFANLEREQRIAEQLSELSERRALINTRIGELKQNIEFWTEQRDRRQGVAYGIVQRFTADILGRDLHTEEEFRADSEVYFNFAEDRVSVNGKANFSASSLTVLRNAFHLGLHWASATSSEFRYPRFTLLDNIEDKGMTQERSWNFQRIILAISQAINVDHQIIFTTSMIAPELDKPELTIGERYDFDHKSLNIAVRRIAPLLPPVEDILG